MSAKLIVRVARAKVGGVHGWAVAWGHPKRGFRQSIYFPTEDQATRAATSNG
jgi:hypothetical protein